ARRFLRGRDSGDFLMPLLAEYAVTPGVLSQDSYTNYEVGDILLGQLKDVVLHEALVRNLHGGEWLQVFRSNDRPWHRRGLELLRKLVNQNRLRFFPKIMDQIPSSEQEWCLEAVESNNVSPLDGVITTSETCSKFKSVSFVGDSQRLTSYQWWRDQRNQPSIRLPRTLDQYSRALELLLECANSIMFIDAHLDPSQYRYSDFSQLLLATGSGQIKPLLEIHRVCYEGSGPSRRIVPNDKWENRFRTSMNRILQQASLSVEVLIWDDFHDRHIITNLVGLHLGNGLDTTRARSLTTWTRLARDDRDDIQREFDPASGRHTLRHRFRVP
ncbi:hypothetical protein MYX78_11795, partial [Acidobacteria bacterium AH-259-G07]|nr:hypothetical protein [Acidobacteria bacterium AH-259-G07]